MHWFYVPAYFSKIFPSFQSQPCESLPRWPWANYRWPLPPGAPEEQQAHPPKALLVQQKGTHGVTQWRQRDEIQVLSCAVLFSSRWTNLLNSSLSLSDLDMSSESYHFSLSLESLEMSEPALTTEAKNEQVWTSVLQTVPEIRYVFHLKSVLNSVNL